MYGVERSNAYSQWTPLCSSKCRQQKAQIKSAIKSSKSAAVKSRLIDQEVIFPFFLKTYYRGHIWLQGAPQVSQTLGTRKFKRSPTYLNCDYTRYNKFSFHTNFVLLLCILDTGVRTLRKTYRSGCYRFHSQYYVLVSMRIFKIYFFYCLIQSEPALIT